MIPNRGLPVRRSSFLGGPPLIALLAAALILGLGAWQILRARQIVLIDAETDARNLSRSLAQQAARTVETVDLVLSGVVHRIESGAMADPGMFKQFLEWRLTTVPQVRDIVVVGSDGNWLTDSIAQPHAPINTADRTYFMWHQENTDRGLHVEAPIESRASGKMFIPLSRRWNKPDGSFGGVVRAALRPEYFQGFYERLGIGSQGTITLMGTSGRVLARYPDSKGMIGRDLSGSPLFRERLPRARAGTFMSRSPIDGVERIAAYERVEDYPLVAFVGRSVSETLEPWRTGAMVEGGVLCLAAAGLIGLGLKLATHQQRAFAAETVIRTSEARYRLLADNTSDIVVLRGLGDERSYVSPACLPLLGYLTEEFLTIPTSEIVHPEDLDRVMRLYRSVGPETPKVMSLHRLKHKDGRWVWIEVVFTHVVNDGNPAVLGVIRDVDERRRQEMERDRAEVALDHMQQGLVTLDADQRVLLFNRRAPELLDLPEEVLHRGAAFADIRAFQRARGDFALVDAQIDARVAGSDLRQLPPAYEWPRPDGTTLEVRGACLPEGGFVYTFSEITARKAAEATAAESETRYREVLEAAHHTILGQLAEGVIVTNASGRITLVNEAAATIHGVARLDVEPDDYSDTYHLYTEDGRPYPPHDLALARAVRGETVSDTRWCIRRPDGTRVLAIGSAQPLRDRNGEQVGAVLTLRDDTAREAAERSLRDVNATLGQRVAERTREVEVARAQAETARAEAERASAAKTEFLAAMSHEIRTPLNGVLGYADLLLEEPTISAPARQHCERIRSSGAALLTIVNDILDFSKIEAGEIDLDPRTFSLAGLIDNCVSIVRGGAVNKSVALKSHIDPALPAMLIGDADRLRQVLLNLLNNAVKFTSKGHVMITAERIEELSNSVSLRILVEDTGIGIPYEKLPWLFERFSQVDSSISRRFGGTGLGLAICKRLVDLMDGRIDVVSREGEGSTFAFTLTLPVGQSAVAQDATTIDLSSIEPCSTDPRRSAHILLAEDLDINQELAKAVLERAGHTVDVASNGAEALQAVQRSAYDLVLMDVQMPVMDGLEATRRIRALSGSMRHVPVIALTANVLPEQIARFRKAGMDDHVGKPFRRDELIAAIARCLPKPGHDPSQTGPRRDGRRILDEASFEDIAELLGSDKVGMLLTRLEEHINHRLIPHLKAETERRTLAAEAHATVSAAGVLGFADLSNLCGEMESACHSGSDIDDLIERAQAACAAALRQIVTLRETRGYSATEPGKMHTTRRSTSLEVIHSEVWLTGQDEGQ